MKLLLIVIMIFLSSPAHAINMNRISMIESSNNPLAVNKNSGARGLFQITKICLKDYNQYHDKKFTWDEMFNSKKNAIVADWYLHERIPQLLKYYGYEVNDRNVLISFNCGVGCLKRDNLPNETKNYVKKYKGE